MDFRIVNTAIIGAAAIGAFFAGRQLCRRAASAIRQSRVPSRPGSSPFDTTAFRAEDVANHATFEGIRATIDSTSLADGPL